MPSVTPISDNVARVRERVRAALRRAGRGEDDATIVAVTKTFGVDIVREIIAAGIADIGENRVQELLAKQESLGGDCRWHLVGPLQRNKAGKVVGRVDLIHSIDSVRIAQTVDRIARERGTRVRVLLEVNTSREASKHGVAVAEAPAAADAIAHLESLDLAGVMTIGPLTGGEAAARECFRTLTRLATELRTGTGRPLPIISMGMSDDFEAALEEGATMLRLGRIMVGERAA
jgi:pyridoxal phosphate enzyme (YggS family)